VFQPVLTLTPAERVPVGEGGSAARHRCGATEEVGAAVVVESPGINAVMADQPWLISVARRTRRSVAGVEVQITGGVLPDQIAVAVTGESPPTSAFTPPSRWRRRCVHQTVWCRCWCKVQAAGVGESDDVGVCIAAKSAATNTLIRSEVTDLPRRPELAISRARIHVQITRGVTADQISRRATNNITGRECGNTTPPRRNSRAPLNVALTLPVYKYNHHQPTAPTHHHDHHHSHHGPDRSSRSPQRPAR